MRNCLFIVALMTVAPPVSCAGELTHGSATDVAMDPQQLENAVKLIERSVAEDEIHGAVVLVARRGKIVLHEAFGWRDIAAKIPMQRDSLFRMASNSKAVTAAGILLLVQDGKLTLDDPVSKYFPTFDTEKARTITIRQLLTHTSGLTIKSLFLKPLIQKSAENPTAPNILLEVARFGAIGPTNIPGSKFLYNNAGYNTLAGIIEKVSGSYKKLLRERIYEPLKMNDSCNHESDADHDRMSTVVYRKEDGSWASYWSPGDKPDYPFPRGSGGMVSTAKDYAIFCQMMLNGGTYNGKRILTEALVFEATNPQAKEIAAAKRYGLGWTVSEPGGTFSHGGSDGTWVWVDTKRELIGMVLTQTQKSSNPRKAFRDLVTAACTDVSTTPKTVAKPEGFYKDVFMSGGTNLTSRKTLHAAESTGLSYEYYAGRNPDRQNRLLIGDADDENGVLLYPDGQPRFRMLYVNGGGATNHGKSLTLQGRQTLRRFNRNGGAYCGSCAGSFLSGRNVDQKQAKRLGYLHIYPFNTLNTGLKKARLDHSIPKNSPLLQYRSFGDDQLVADVYHNNGNWISTTDGDHLKDTQILATYVNPGHKTDAGGAIWAYQRNETTGRIVNIGSHPEGADEGERLALTEACFLYAMDGTGRPPVKGQLKPGETRKMDATTKDENPEYTRIGDGQYHHFQFELDSSHSKARINVSTENNADLNVYLSRDEPAFQSNAKFRATTSAASESLTAKLEPGTWFVSVECATRVNAVEDADSGFYRYYQNIELLNGVPYEISLTMEK